MSDEPTPREIWDSLYTFEQNRLEHHWASWKYDSRRWLYRYDLDLTLVGNGLITHDADGRTTITDLGCIVRKAGQLELDELRPLPDQWGQRGIATGNSGLPDKFLYTDDQRRDTKIAAMQVEIDALKAQLDALTKRLDDGEGGK